jgi:L-threonylcarbamoyladenylate synthase
MASSRAELLPCSCDGIAQAAAMLRAGGLVAFPTETVYGLGANALDTNAVLSIFRAKGRPLTDPVIVHVPASRLMLNELFEFDESNAAAKAVVYALAEDFWPGPLTVIFKAGPSVPDCVTASTGFVGVRSPRHIVAQRLLEAAGVPVAAPSANRFGHVSPTSSAHVVSDLGAEAVLVLEDEMDGGCSIGIESTVCRVSSSGDRVSILRCGAVTSCHLEAALALRGLFCVVSVDNEKALKTKDEHSVAPGQMIKHYAPDVPTFVYRAVDGDTPEEGFTHRPAAPVDARRVVVIDYGQRLATFRAACGPRYLDLSPEGRAEEACRGVFRALRRAEDLHREDPGAIDLVLLPDLRALAETDQVVRALWERLHRAASGVFMQPDAVLLS